MSDWGKFTPLVEGLDPAKLKKPPGGHRDPLVNAHPKENPCLAVFGAGPVGVTCKTCTHLQLWGGNSRNYYKCALRGHSSGPGTDHRVNWPACKRYEERTEETNN